MMGKVRVCSGTANKKPHSQPRERGWMVSDVLPYYSLKTAQKTPED